MDKINDSAIAEFIGCVRAQAAQHGAFSPQDGVKLCYQAAFGAEHMLNDKQRALDYFNMEYQSLAKGKDPIFEQISKDYCRANLRGWQNAALDKMWLFNMFYSTAAKSKKAMPIEAYLDAIGELADGGELPFGIKQWQEYRSEYEKGGIRAIHHSENYRQMEKPAYRVILREFEKIMPVLDLCKNICPQGNKPCVIAIDGRAAAGKSTFANLLSQALGADVVHMDDFFLPKELRTAQRLSDIGGNVHYERFIEQVLPKLKTKEPFEYDVFDCGSMAFSKKRSIEGGDWIIVEGSYGLHEKFGEYANLKLFLDVDEKTQLCRITKRNGEAMAEVFQSRWIPMEEKYFKGSGVMDKADMVLRL